jgi:hypothetical protein
MTEMIQIGCRLPQGYTLEIGLQTTVKDTVSGRPITNVQRTESYQRVVLVGTNANFRKTRLRLPSTLNPEPHVNTIPKALWDQWKAEHPKAWVIRSGNLFELPKGQASIDAALLDMRAKPNAFAPLDPTKKTKVGPEGQEVETANFNE